MRGYDYQISGGHRLQQSNDGGKSYHNHILHKSIAEICRCTKLELLQRQHTRAAVA